jgi:Ca2+-binding EF-hand superfamily protein
VLEEALIVSDLEPIIKTSGVGDKCQMLLRKLHMHTDEGLQFDEFSALFNFDLSKPENFNILFELFDIQGKGYISLDDLKSVNARYSTNNHH